MKGRPTANAAANAQMKTGVGGRGDPLDRTPFRSMIAWYAD
jgi:hypothetical protein